MFHFSERLKKLHSSVLDVPPTVMHCYIHNLIPLQPAKSEDNSDHTTPPPPVIKWTDAKWKSIHSIHIKNWSRNRLLRLKV